MLGTAALYVETTSENPLAALANEVTEATLKRLPVKILREILEGIHAISGAKVSKSGNKTELIHRILTSPHKANAVKCFLEDKDVQEQRKIDRLLLKLFTSLRGALRQAGVEILRALHLPYSVPVLFDDKLPEGVHRPGECPDSDDECLVCRAFGSLKQKSIFRNYTPPLVDDPDKKLDIPQEVNHVLIRTHARNVHRPDGSTLNFNQQYFAGTFVTYFNFPHGLPSPVELGFLLNCLEACPEVGAAKAWGAGKLFLQSYTLEKVEVAYEREWDGAVIQLALKTTIIPLKAELDQVFAAYAQWLSQVRPPVQETDEGEVIA
jgi:hypothetical protein